MKRQLRLNRLKALEKEWRVARLAVRLLESRARVDASMLIGEEMEYSDVLACVRQLAATYLIRLFAEFEAGLRDWWQIAKRRKSRPTTRQLVDSVAASRSIPIDLRDDVHAVREYRNRLVHEGHYDPVPMSLDIARGHLCRFFSWMPLDW